MSITAISIRNFRSIAALNETTRDLNIFVGQNDEGKSNVLRALDLFFNFGKRGGYELDWNRDFCCFAPKRVGKAEEIEISLEITPPTTFTNTQAVIWRRVWRKAGLHVDSVAHKNKDPVSPKSKIAAFLRAIRFDYVPAIKGTEYFGVLMSALYDMLEVTVAGSVRTASGSFTTTINQHTQPILTEILQSIGLQSTIQLPADLRTLFAQLEFTSVAHNLPFALSQRGDGIKVRHIPIVLRWLANQANHLSAKGRPKTVTVWGYEEPENNLELRRCFELAKEFVDGSSEIQAFVTTHSPAFYSVFRQSAPAQVGLFLVTKDTQLPVTKIAPLKDGDLLSLDSSMGLLELLEPHVREAAVQLGKMKAIVAELSNTTKPTIFCEGPSDKTLFDCAISQFFPDKAATIEVKCSTHHGGGHGWVCERLVAWSFSRPTAKAVGVFDKDEGAKRSKEEAEKKINIPGSGKMAFSVLLEPNEELKKCFAKRISIPFASEELLTEDMWAFAESEAWLEERSDVIALYKFERRDVTFNAHIESELSENHLRRLALKKMRLENKEALAEHVLKQSPTEKQRILAGLKPTLEKCFERLGIA